MSVVGVDASARGWIAVVLPSSGPPRGVFAASLSALSEAVPDAQAYGLDIPIGLPDVARHPDGLRPADVRARAFLGEPCSSVFFAPIREALLAPTHAQATRHRNG